MAISTLGNQRERFGNKQWEKVYKEGSSAISLHPTPDDGFIISGSIDSMGSGRQALLIKTDSSGKEEWTMPLDRTGESIGTSVVESTD